MTQSKHINPTQEEGPRAHILRCMHLYRNLSNGTLKAHVEKAGDS